jgi:hypothetical protein
MVALICFVLAMLASPFKSKSRLEAENAALRHQLIVLRRKVRGRAHLRDVGALASGRLSSLLALEIALTGRAPANRDRTARADPADERGEFSLGAPRIHGELLKLGFEIAQSSVAKYMVKRCGRPSQGWRTFLRNHAPDIAAMDFFVVPSLAAVWLRHHTA